MSMRQQPEGQLQQLSMLRQEVKLTSSKLLDLTYHQVQYIDTLEQYNSKARELIVQDMLEEALVYLGEAERLLEYGASCGKNIDRGLIICTLHNEACCYYKANQLVTASRYIEGVIFNLKTHVDSLDSSPANSSASQQRGRKSTEIAASSIDKKVELVHYYLKYCTINSQAKNRIIALDAGKRTIQVLKSVISDAKEHRALCGDATSESQGLVDLVSGVRFFKEQIGVADVGNLLALTRHYLKKWNEDKLVKKISYNLEKHVSNYSISEVIEMVPMEYQPEGQLPTGSKVLMRQMLHFSMGYFTISTEYRLISEQLYRKSEERQLSQQYIKANIYHLLSVLFLSLYLHCDLLFMKQIISSYDHHFKSNLLQEESLDNHAELAQKVLFEAPPQRKKSINSSLSAKLHKLKSKSKERNKIHTQYEDTELYESKACYNLNETKTKRKRSKSNQKLPSKNLKAKKCGTILNESLFDSTKNVNISKENKPRSISGANNSKQRSVSKKLEPKKQAEIKQRSTSKDSEVIRPIKLPIKIVDKVIGKDKKASNKRYNDEYQLSNAKCPAAKKRSRSISSADLSCSLRDTNRTKVSGESSVSKKRKTKLKGAVSGGKEGLSKGKQAYSKHYYV